MQTPVITIREAMAEELDAVGALLVKVYASLDGFPKPADQPAYYHMLANAGDLLAKPETIILVALVRDCLLGTVVYYGDMQYYGSGGQATREQYAAGFRLLAVDAEARGLGIGKMLAQACIDRAVASGRRQLIIHTTDAMQTAWRMYEKLHFRRAMDLDFMQGTLPVYGFRLPLQGE